MNYYETLNVTKEATDEEIKKAYKKLAMKHHPDKNQGNKESEEEFKKINEAYQNLSDPRKRQMHDMSLNGGGGYQSFEFNSMNDIFGNGGININDIFNHFQSRQSRNRLGIKLGFWESAFGCDKSFTVSIPQDNKKSKKINFNVKFEPGTDDGTVLHIKSEGEEFDLIVSVEDDLLFEKSGLDLYTRLDVPLTTAILGGDIVFPHWERDIQIGIPEGATDGQILRLRNLGLANGAIRGNLYVKLNLITPNKLTKKQRELIEEFQKLEKTKETSCTKKLKSLWSKLKLRS